MKRNCVVRQKLLINPKVPKLEADIFCEGRETSKNTDGAQRASVPQRPGVPSFFMP